MVAPEHLVSTHSRPKAAGFKSDYELAKYWGFNTQPPEGGWPPPPSFVGNPHGFNTQPPEGGWFSDVFLAGHDKMFQHTAARRRLVCF